MFLRTEGQLARSVIFERETNKKKGDEDVPKGTRQKRNRTKE